MKQQQSIYARAIAHYPQLATVKEEITFCRILCRLPAIPTITVREYIYIAAIADCCGMETNWEEVGTEESKQ